MLKRRNKIETDLGQAKPENRILRLLRSDKSFAPSLHSPEEREQGNGFVGSRKEIENALLETECSKSEALLRWQQIQRPY